jgi:hypothetical protein
MTVSHVLVKQLQFDRLFENNSTDVTISLFLQDRFGRELFSERFAHIPRLYAVWLAGIDGSSREGPFLGESKRQRARER